MFTLFYNGMFADSKKGTFPIEWNGKTYHVFVPWILDNYQTMKGMKYFMPNGKGLIDIMRQSQRDDGMIYSYIQYQHNVDYFLTRDKFSGYSKRIGDKVFVRQPVENHPEYLYVNTIYAVWKSDGNEAWMKKNLESAERALDYAPNEPSLGMTRGGKTLEPFLEMGERRHAAIVDRRFCGAFADGRRPQGRLRNGALRLAAHASRQVESR